MTIRASIFWLLALGLLAGGGCGGPGYDSGTVTGQVTIDGQPVPKGYVTFSPSEHGQGPVTGGEIVSGAYAIANVPLGSHTVTFIAHAAETQKIQDVANNATREVPIDLLPPQYRSGVPAEVRSGRQEIPFDLKRAP